MKNFLVTDNLKKEEMEKIFEMAEKLGKENFFPRPLTAGLIFDRPSTRMRVSFEVALHQLGIHPIYLDYVFSQLTRGERIEDAGKVLSGYVNIIIARLHKHEMLQRLAKSSLVPVINAATDLEHPCQVLSDLYTIKQHGLLKKGVKIAYIGNPNSNVANALLSGARKFEMEIIFICPPGYSPNPDYRKNAKITNDFAVTVDIAYTNAFDAEEELKDFLPYIVNRKRMHELNAKFSMHPLPAFRGMEISDDVLDAQDCLAWEQAKNKVVVQKALVQYLLDNFI